MTAPWPKPDWECEGVRLYHGDCLEIVPQLPAGCIDAVVTDPPWKASDGSRIRRSPGDGLGVAPAKLSTSLRYGSIGRFNAEIIRDCNRISAADVLVLCGYMELGEVLAAVGKVRGIFGWHNTRPTPIPGAIAARDLAFIVWGGRQSRLTGRWDSCVFAYPGLQAGCMATERILNADGTTAHPAQEPLNLFAALIQPLGASVLDPYMGSGTTGVACVQSGRDFVGIEIEQRYFDIAVTRIDQERRQRRMFT